MFKIGDKVRRINGDNYSAKDPEEKVHIAVGDEGVVVGFDKEEDPPFIIVRITKGEYTGEEISNDPDNLELIKSRYNYVRFDNV